MQCLSCMSALPVLGKHPLVYSRVFRHYIRVCTHIEYNNYTENCEKYSTELIIFVGLCPQQGCADSDI